MPFGLPARLFKRSTKTRKKPRRDEPLEQGWTENLDYVDPVLLPAPQIHALADDQSFRGSLPRGGGPYPPSVIPPPVAASHISHPEDLTEIDYGHGDGARSDADFSPPGRRREEDPYSHGRRRSRSRGKNRTRRTRVPDIVIHPPSNASLSRAGSPGPLPVPPPIVRGASFGKSGSRFAETRSIPQYAPSHDLDRDLDQPGVHALDYAYPDQARSGDDPRAARIVTNGHAQDRDITGTRDIARTRTRNKSEWMDPASPMEPPTRTKSGGWIRKLHSLEHPNFQFSRCTGTKKALCIGINYIGQSAELHGCINDANNACQFLADHYNFKKSNIMVMTDDSHDQQLLPTRANLISGMHWLLQDAQPHDSLFIHYSGHGARAREASGGDEADGYDEMIFPQDYKHAGTILDDELHKLLVAPLPSGCRLTAVFDSCHSGSVMDLVYNYHSNGKVKRIPVRRSFVEAKTTPGDVMCWSGCDDEETSADAHEGGLAVGAMSYAILKVLRGNPKITYEDLLKGLRRETKKYNQKPQLSASHRMDIDRRFTM